MRGEKQKPGLEFRTNGFASGITACCRRGVIGLLVSSSLIPSSLSWAAHPFITDDAGTQGKGNWQLELMAQRDHHDRAADAGAGPVQQRSRSTLFNPVLTYGLLDKVDVALGLSRSRYRTTENGIVAREASGAADSTLELKWRVYEQDGLSLALKPGLTLPTGDENRGLGAGRTSWGMNLIADYEVEPWIWLANIAYNRARYKLLQDQLDNSSDLWRVSGGVEYIVRKELRLTGELGVRTTESRNDPFLPGRHARFAMLGLVYSPTKKLDFDVGFRKRLNRAETDKTFLVGTTVRW
jgi:hypothetical protein